MANLPEGVFSLKGQLRITRDFFNDKSMPSFFPTAGARECFDKHYQDLIDGKTVEYSGWLPRGNSLNPLNLTAVLPQAAQQQQQQQQHPPQVIPFVPHLCIAPTSKGACVLECDGPGTCPFQNVPADACPFFLRDGLCVARGTSCPFGHYVVDRLDCWFRLPVKKHEYCADVQVKSRSSMKHFQDQARERRLQAEDEKQKKARSRRHQEAEELALEQARAGDPAALSACCQIFGSSANPPPPPKPSRHRYEH